MARITIFSLLLLSLYACAGSVSVNNADIPNVSLVRLLANPHHYANKLIITSGYICLGKGNSAITISGAACAEQEGALGIGLQGLKPKFMIERESHGFPGYGIVIGEFHATKSNEVLIDTPYQVGSITAYKVRQADENFVVTYNVAEVIGTNTTKYKLVTEFIKNWITSVVDKNYTQIASGLIPDSSSFFDDQVKSLQSKNSRLYWVLFKAANSIAKSFQSKTFYDVDVFRRAGASGIFDKRYIVCVCAVRNCPSFPPIVSHFLMVGKRFCVGVDETDKSKLYVSFNDLNG